MHVLITENDRKKYRYLFWLLLATITLIRAAGAGSFGLGTDEAHYVMYARHLAWGYFDHPPMVAFLAALTTSLGKSPFFVRLGPIICSTLSLIILRYIALALYRDERVAFWAMLLLQLMPYQHLLMVGLLPDATLNLFWCGTLLAGWHAVRGGTWAAWLLAGLFFGGALLSKYHAVLLPLCFGGYLIASPNHRYWVRRIKPYAALGVGLIVFLPNIVWNSRHAWISYKFQLARGGGDGFALENIVLSLGGQFAVWSPIIFGGLIICLVLLMRRKPLADPDRFAIWTSMPVFVFFCGIGVFGKILPHWTAAGWWTGALVVTRVGIQKLAQKKQAALRWRRWAAAATAAGLVMTLALYAGILYPIVGPIYARARNVSILLHQKIPAIQPLGPYQAKFDISNDLFGWDKIARQVEAIRAGMPRPEQTFIFSHRFFPASQLGVYLNPQTVITSLRHRPSQYHLWFSPEKYRGWDALFVDEDRRFKGPDRYRPLFGGMNAKPHGIVIHRRGYLAHEIRIYEYYDFKGTLEQ